MPTHRLLGLPFGSLLEVVGQKPVDAVGEVVVEHGAARANHVMAEKRIVESDQCLNEQSFLFVGSAVVSAGSELLRGVHRSDRLAVEPVLFRRGTRGEREEHAVLSQDDLGFS